MFLSILCKKCPCLENWHGKIKLTVWAGGLGVWDYCVLWQCSQLWHPSVLDAVPLVQPPSYPNSMLSELTFFCSINRCFLVALYPLVPADWRVVFHPAGKGGCRQAWQAFLHSFKHSGAKSLFSKMSQDDNVGPLMLSVGEGTLSSQPCCSPRWESTQGTSFFSKEAGRSHCSQRYNGWTWTRMEFSHLCHALNVWENRLGEALQNLPNELLLCASLFFEEQWCRCKKCLSLRVCQETMLALNRLLLPHS